MPSKITVTFTADFVPYGIKAGATRDVSPDVAHKLLDNYHVIADPFNVMPKYPLVRLTKKLKYGADWYPMSLHMVTPEIARQLIGEGSAVLVDPSEKTVRTLPEGEDGSGHAHNAFCPEHPDVEAISAWLNSHEYATDAIRIVSISLACQISQKEAESVYRKILDFEETKSI